MSRLREHEPLQGYNTFGLAATARYFAHADSVATLRAILASPQAQAGPLLILGGGSNLLLTADFPGLVIKIDLQGIEKTAETDHHVWVRAGAGENWHQFVMHCLDQNWAGLENLSLIPGTVGAAPMQNIGAYGVELKDTFTELEAVEIATGDLQRFDREACQFGYRESIFKHWAKGRFVITSVTFKLDKQATLHTHYGAITDTLKAMQVAEPTIRTVSQAVIHIRQSKLPDPAKLGNAGSFFKNPEIPTPQFEQLQAQHPGLPGYPGQAPGFTKVAAGWLIEQCGWRGKRVGNTGAHRDQALVLVNYGGATGQEIWALAQAIQQSVRERFGIELRAEVNVV
ncbi:MAG: UDP-N-acetylmuramate dehydrogenase [Bernardetiaceae bacterium]|jgi:UDP-N-acetylmuramate dehydrogenase|nr:UDP-N-acetylmuramate dehydrogenase [Bernardetiaceae bacterium]